MATDVLSLFNMPTQEQLGRSYLEGMLTSPAQMGAQSLLQQVVSLGGNAGAGIGYGVGRLMGGMTADEVRAKSIDDAMRTVQGMGLTSDAEMYGALSQELARRGLTQDALKARDVGLKAAQTEQSMRTEQARLGIAQEDLKLKQAQDKREAELAPIKIEALKEDIFKTRESLKPVQQKLAEAATEIEKLSVEKPNSPELRAALGRYQGFVDTIDKANKEIAFKERELSVRERQAGATEKQAQAAIARAEAAADNDKYTIPVYAEGTFPGTRGDIIGRQNKQGQVLGNDGYVYRSVNELKAATNPKADTGGDNKGGVKPNAPSLADLRANAGGAGQSASSIDQQIAQMETMLQAARRSGDQRVIGNYSQALADLQNQKKVIASQVGR